MRTWHDAWLFVAGGDEQYGKLSQLALAVHFQSVLTKEVNVLFVSNCGRLLFLSYSTAYTLTSIKGSKKTWETYPQLIATEIQSYPLPTSLPSAFVPCQQPFMAFLRPNPIIIVCYHQLSPIQIQVTQSSRESSPICKYSRL